MPSDADRRRRPATERDRRRRGRRGPTTIHRRATSRPSGAGEPVPRDRGRLPPGGAADRSAAGRRTGRSGCGPCFGRAAAFERRSARRSRTSVMSSPSAALNASSSVRPSAYERMSVDQRVAGRASGSGSRPRRRSRRRRGRIVEAVSGTGRSARRAGSACRLRGAPRPRRGPSTP